MKKILSILGIISFITSGSSNLIGCNNTPTLTSEELSELKEKNSKIINGNKLEWIEPQEKPFNTVDNKWYVVIWRGDENENWRLIKYKNNTLDFIEIDNFEKADLWKSSPYKFGSGQTLNIAWTFKEIYWENDNGTYFKSVYRWDEQNEPPMLKINSDGEIEN